VKLEKFVNLAADRDLAGVARRSDQDVVASVPDGGVAGKVIDVDRLADVGFSGTISMGDCLSPPHWLFAIGRFGHCAGPE
jgi:hypothetical protein